MFSVGTGSADLQARRGLMHALIAGQLAFCVLAVFVVNLLVATFTRLSQQPTGFSPDRVPSGPRDQSSAPYTVR